MPPADLLAALRRRPFEPFRLICLDGMVYEVNHPELVMVAIGSALVFADQYSEIESGRCSALSHALRPSEGR